MKKPANFDVQPADQSRELWFFPTRLQATEEVLEDLSHARCAYI
jgi:hypothetical protein